MTQNSLSLAAATASRASLEEAEGFQVKSAETAGQPERDRIAAAYLGSWGSLLTQQRARARIDWMAGSAKGPRILDIGCSEGILAVLLARAGHDVVGVDIEPAAIAAGGGRNN